MSEIERLIQLNRHRLGMTGGDTSSEPADARTRIAVYGTMRPGGPAAHVLEPYKGNWSKGTINGYLLGVCDAGGCPGLAWDPAGDPVEAFILDAPGLAQAWPAIDAKEGADLARILVPVAVEGGGTVVANIYASADATRARLLMRDGDNVHDTVDDRAQGPAAILHKI